MELCSRKHPKRKINRLANYDYAENGAYFVTLCAKEKAHIFGKILSTANVGACIARPQTQLSAIGELVEAAISSIDKHYQYVYVDKYVIMPNHIHMIVFIDGPAGGRAMHAPTLAQIMTQFKGIVSKQAKQKIWQKSYYDHVIRNQHDYEKTWEYIDYNPDKWCDDQYY